MDLTQKELTEIEYEKAEERYNEQKYICDSLRTAINTIQDYLDWSEARDTIVDELENTLEGVESTLLCYEAALSAAEKKLTCLETDSIYGTTN